MNQPEHVNFIDSRKFQMTYLMLFGVLVGYFVLMSMGASALRLQFRFAQNQVRALGQEVMQLKEKQKGMTLAEGSGSNEVNPLVISMKNARRWATALNEVGRHVPRGMWLTSISASQPGKIKLVGHAAKMRTISTFQASLDRSPLFEQALLAASQQDREDGEGVEKGLMEFTLTCALKSL
jgi:Tfp pilus assembly protein PilN